jgi:hypothetical protein
MRRFDKDEWLYSTENEFVRLTNCIMSHMPSGSETVYYLPHKALPKGRKAIYARFVETCRPHNTDTKRIRLTGGGSLIHYLYKVRAPTSDLSTLIFLLNSVISTPIARFATFDLKYFHLSTAMVQEEYMRMSITSIPQPTIDQYRLLDLIHNRFVLVETCRGMCGLPHTGT